MPAAGLPSTVSNTCVVIALIHTKPLSQTNLRDLALLLGGLTQFGRAIAGQAALENGRAFLRRSFRLRTQYR